jgi:SAM-dependent methyltransferase
MVHEGQAKHEAEAIAGNRSNWDDRAEVHVRSEMYDVGGFLADRAAISRVVQNDLSSLSTHLPASGVRDRSLLHLQCHIGIDTISWARLGAVEVHGLDLSPNSLRHAARIAKADDREITWVEGDARFASTLIDRRFDTIVTSAGTIVWLPELATWAQSIHDLLEPGGVRSQAPGRRPEESNEQLGYSTLVERLHCADQSHFGRHRAVCSPVHFQLK